MGVARLRLLSSALLLLLVTLVPAQADTKPERVVYTLGPVTGEAGGFIAVLRARLSDKWMKPTFSQDGGTIRVELNRPEDDGFLRTILTRQGAFSIHGDVADQQGCSGVREVGRICLSVAESNDRFMAMDAEPVLAGAAIAEVARFRDPGNMPAMLFRFTPEAASLFAAYTTRSVGQRVALVIDGVVAIAPVIREPIVGGQGVLTGSEIDVRTWLALLAHPPLPAPLELISVEPAVAAD